MAPSAAPALQQIVIIAATDQAGGIGIGNRLPWRLPEDLAHFKKITSGYPVIMGRKTFDSIGRPLPNRHNIVITRNPAWRHDGVDQAGSLDAAFQLVKTGRAYVIGGMQIFQEALPYASQMILTEIDQQFDCDTFFPRFDLREWQMIARDQHHSESNNFDYAYVTYHRIS